MKLRVNTTSDIHSIRLAISRSSTVVVVVAIADTPAVRARTSPTQAEGAPHPRANLESVRPISSRTAPRQPH
ncbi:hypothetical protein SVAN01_07844 [Stagonosporopsis vannaccii]|nr:hypothetical protein SVAN01_07844 [Stagonosporopsis vannaccii]